MRIAQIVCTYPPYYGGMGNVVFAAARELVRRGHEVEIFTPRYFESKEIKPKEAEEEPRHEPELESQLARVRAVAPEFRFGNAARLGTVLKELDRFELVHLHYPFFGTANLVRRWKKRHPAAPLVITYHMDTRGPGWKGLVFKTYSRFWMPRILRAADRLIVSSFDYAAASDAARVYRAAPEQWMELPFGVDTERFHPGGTELTNQTPRILFVGGMDAAHYFKGIPILLTAVYLLRQRGRRVLATFVGDGDLRAGFELKAKGLGISDAVRFVGSVSDAALPGYYREADVVVLPSLHRGEAFGMVLLEALASGVPVIASDLPGVRTIPKDAGMLVPPGDAVALAAALETFFSTMDRAAMSVRARQVAEEAYAWPQIIDKLEALYQSLVPPKSS